ncbi:hypothetical protein [Enterococcus gilvus]|uniref:hypothetical protein n=1 Tax=Enterococcus gilvus TaxID=160453 RepID=UPI003ED8CF50
MKKIIVLLYLTVLLGTVFFVVGGLLVAQVSTFPSGLSFLRLFPINAPTMPIPLMHRLGTSPILWGSSFLVSFLIVQFQTRKEEK